MKSLRRYIKEAFLVSYVPHITHRNPPLEHIILNMIKITFIIILDH